MFGSVTMFRISTACMDVGGPHQRIDSRRYGFFNKGTAGKLGNVQML